MAVAALLLLAGTGPLDTSAYGVQAAKVKAQTKTGMIDEDDDVSEADKVDSQILQLSQLNGAPVSSPYFLLAQSQGKPVMLAQQPTGRNFGPIMDTQLLDTTPVVQTKQVLVQTGQELQARTENASSSGMKVLAQKPTSGAIDLEGDMLQVMT